MYDDYNNQQCNLDTVNYILTLPMDIRGSYDTVVNKVMISNFKFDLPIDSSFYRDLSALIDFDDKEFLKFAAVVMYDVIAVNIVNEMWSYIQQYPKLLCRLDFTECVGPAYPEEIISMVIYYLRKRGFNAVKYSKGAVMYVCIDNFNSGGDKKTRFKKSVSYLATAMFSGIRDDLPTVDIDVESIVNNMSYGPIKTKIIAAMEIQPVVKTFLADIDYACDSLNSTKCLDRPLVRMHELYLAMSACLEAIGDICGSAYTEQRFYLERDEGPYILNFAMFLKTEDLLDVPSFQDFLFFDTNFKRTNGFKEPIADMDNAIELMQSIVVSYYNLITASFTNELGVVTMFKGPYDFSFIK